MTVITVISVIIGISVIIITIIILLLQRHLGVIQIILSLRSNEKLIKIVWKMWTWLTAIKI